MEERLARPDALSARLGPRFTAPAAHRADAMNGHAKRDFEAVERLATRQGQLGREHLAARRLPEKRVTHAFDDTASRRKINRDLVGEAVLRHARYDTDRGYTLSRLC